MFAYGATGAGKTHTMLGSQNDPGVMYRTMKELFKRMDDAKEEKEFTVAFSYLEVNNGFFYLFIFALFSCVIDGSVDSINYCVKWILSLVQIQKTFRCKICLLPTLLVSKGIAILICDFLLLVPDFPVSLCSLKALA